MHVGRGIKFFCIPLYFLCILYFPLYLFFPSKNPFVGVLTTILGDSQVSSSRRAFNLTTTQRLYSLVVAERHPKQQQENHSLPSSHFSLLVLCTKISLLQLYLAVVL
jgi:hypothetical protein